MDSNPLAISKTLITGIQNIADNQNIYGSAGNWGHALIGSIYGKYGEATRRGLSQSGRSGAATTIPVNSGLSNTPTLWNPASSGQLVFPQKINLSQASLGTPVIMGFTLSYVLACGDAAGTNLPLATFTNITPVNNLLGKGVTAKAKFAHATVTYTANPTVFMDIGLGMEVEGTAATGAPYVLTFDLDGMLCLPPGTAIVLGAATAASSMTYWATITWTELPVTQGF
jgi:hypothetical protein